jgi:hypothetical protein
MKKLLGPAVGLMVLACPLSTAMAADTQAPAVTSATSATDTTKAAVPERFQKICTDNAYTYYMDMQNAHWITCPHTSDEKIVDVWVKLVQDDDDADKTDAASKDGYTYPAKYYLEHYYIRPDKQQIQFLSELEVTGRPTNAINERPYNASHWENLVPGSVEDDIYHAVLEKMKKAKAGSKGSMSVRDGIEEYLRISL